MCPVSPCGGSGRSNSPGRRGTRLLAAASRADGTFPAGDTLRTVTLAIPALIALVGMSVLLARRQPLVPVAVLFFVMGIYAGQTWAGHQVTDGLDQLARWIG